MTAFSDGSGPHLPKKNIFKHRIIRPAIRDDGTPANGIVAGATESPDKVPGRLRKPVGDDEPSVEVNKNTGGSDADETIILSSHKLPNQLMPAVDDEDDDEDDENNENSLWRSNGPIGRLTTEMSVVLGIHPASKEALAGTLANKLNTASNIETLHKWLEIIHTEKAKPGHNFIQTINLDKSIVAINREIANRSRAKLEDDIRSQTTKIQRKMAAADAKIYNPTT